MKLGPRERALARAPGGIEWFAKLEHPHGAVPQHDPGAGVGLRPAPLRRVAHLTGQVGIEGGDDVGVAARVDRPAPFVAVGDAPVGVARAARQPICKGFAVVRTIFGRPAETWMRGEIDDAEAVRRMATSYARLISAWEALR